ncbi:MAG: ribonuclease HI family protein [Solirubrobacteraceae bacterium]
MRVTLNVDGGSRGNPGPAAIGVVVSDADGTVLEKIAQRIGVATNNVAEYRALLRGVAAARELGADELEIIGDSELVARQLTGAYRVKNAALKPLHAEVLGALNGLSWRIRTVPRAQNSRADALVNAALDRTA